MVAAWRRDSDIGGGPANRRTAPRFGHRRRAGEPPADCRRMAPSFGHRRPGPGSVRPFVTVWRRDSDIGGGTGSVRPIVAELHRAHGSRGAAELKKADPRPVTA